MSKSENNPAFNNKLKLMRLEKELDILRKERALIPRVGKTVQSFRKYPDNYFSFNEADKFICDANFFHNSRFDYSKVDYDKSTSPIIITCPEHGDFEETPHEHLSFCGGCPKCDNKHILNSDVKRRDMFYYVEVLYFEDEEVKPEIIVEETHEVKLSPRENFILKAKAIHGDKYDYSKVIYKSTRDKVTLICDIHGAFDQTPNNHLYCKSGCRKCSFKLNALAKQNETKQNESVYEYEETNGEYSPEFLDFLKKL